VITCVQMILLFIVKQLHVLETKICTMYEQALQLLEVSLYVVCQMVVTVMISNKTVAA